MSPEQELLNILFQGEMELAMRRIMSFEMRDEAVRMYQDATGYTVARSLPDRPAEIVRFDNHEDALTSFDMITGFIRLQVDCPDKDQTSS